MRWLSRLSVRLRLALACTVVAAMVGFAGLLLFDALLHRGVAASVDTVLAARSSRAVADFRSERLGDPERDATDAPTARQPAAGQQELDSLTVIYRPSGAVASSTPAGTGTGLLGAEDFAEARSGILHLTVDSEGHEPLRVLAVPVASTGGTWVVAVATSLVPATAAANRAVRDLYVGLPVLVLLVAVGAWLLAGAALRPVERMRADADELIGSDSSAALITVPATSDELARLGHTFNRLLARLQRSLARQRDLVADAGHELRTPLTVLRTELELADSPGRTREDLAESIAHARREVDRLSKLADDILFLARADGAAPLVRVETVEVAAVLDETVRAHRVSAASAGITIECAVAPDLLVAGDHLALRRALDNLLTNSLAAVGPGGRIRLTAQRRGGLAVIEVADDGPGFPPGFVERAFERFSRPEKTAGSSEWPGAGLGLSIVAEIARALNGAATAANSEDGGAVVAIELPLNKDGDLSSGRRRVADRRGSAGTG